MAKTCVVVPNWNGKDSLGDCLDSLKNQSLASQIIVVDNGSSDGSPQYVENRYPEAVLIRHKKNLGFAGGVNSGIRKAIELGAGYVALLNNDAVADKNWLEALASCLDKNPKIGIATAKILDSRGHSIDSTGEIYTVWGLPYPRGRGQTGTTEYDGQTEIFGASGGASLYRVKMLKDIGLFDQDFFAYYEDVDLSFRAQLGGWKIAFVPGAVVHHKIGATSSRISGFAAYHTIKNLPLLLWKNVPWALMPKIWPRLLLAYGGITFRALARGQYSALFKGVVVGVALLPKKTFQRNSIQRRRRVSPAYINSIIEHDLPPNARSLRRLRSGWWKLTRKAAK